MRIVYVPSAVSALTKSQKRERKRVKERHDFIIKFISGLYSIELSTDK